MTKPVDHHVPAIQRRIMLASLLLGVAVAPLAIGSAQAQVGPPNTTPTTQADPTSSTAPSGATALPGSPTTPAAPDNAAEGTANSLTQDAGATGDLPQADVVVTGYRRSIETSLAQKRNANSFVDVITAEDVGKFPDKDVADALQRVPGVIITRDGGEGDRVSIRGLDPNLTLTELNGNFLASADSGDPERSFSYLLLPANLIGSTEVFKSPEARLDEGGVGGLIINHTRKPFDLKPWSGNIQVEGTYADVTEKVEPDVSGLLSWHNDGKTLGVLVGATYQVRTNRDLSSNTESWHWWTDDRTKQPAVDVNGKALPNQDAVSYWNDGQGGGQTVQVGSQAGKHYSGYWAPQSVDATILDQKRKRLGIQGTVQAQPFDNLLVTANYFRFQLSGNYTTNQLKIPEWGYGNFFSGATLDPSGTIFTGASFQVPAEGTGCRTGAQPCTMETPALQSTISRQKTVSNTYDVHADWTHDRLAISGVVGRTRATGGPSFEFGVQAKPRLTTATQNINGNTLSQWQFTDKSVAMTFSPDIQQNILNGISQIDLGSTGSGLTNTIISQRYAQLDLTRKFDTFIDSVQVGGKWRDSYIVRSTAEFDYYSDPATLLRYQDTAGAAVSQPGFFLSKPVGNIAGGFTATTFPGFNTPAYIDYLTKTYGAAVFVPQPQNEYRIDERIWAGYVQLNYKFNRLRGNIGLRVANTRQSGTSTDVIYYEDDYCVNTNGNPFIPPPRGADGNCLVLPQQNRERRVYSPNNEGKSYTDFLPSFNFSYDITDNLLFRGEASKVIARPNYGDLGGSRNLTFNSDAFVYDRGQFGALPGWFGSGGNFDLKPFRAWQYDVGIEWYFHRGSVLGMTLFRKDVSDFIVPLVIDLQQPVAGQSVLVQQYSTLANGASAKSQGVEVYAQHTLSFGLGAQANFTYNDTSQADVSINGQNVGTSPLVGSAKTQVNVSVYYEHGPVLLRASYNRRGTKVDGLESGLNIYEDPYTDVDLNAALDLYKNLKLTASVINLTKSEQRVHLGNDTEARFYSNDYSGRRVYFGLSYNF